MVTTRDDPQPQTASRKWIRNWQTWRQRRRDVRDAAKLSHGTLSGLSGFVRASPMVAFLAIVSYGAAGHLKEGSTFLSVLGIGTAAAGASLLTGVLLGFLFGLPRARERPDAKGRLTTNTNLDQISDWLTKILVGLGLVQLGKVTHGVGTLASTLAPGLGNGAGAKSFAVALLVYSAADGFLFGYLWTRIDLSRRFRIAAEDLDPVEQTREQILQAPPPKGLEQPE